MVVNPTAPIGDHDWKPTPTGKIVVDFLRRKMPAYVDTGLNVVDVTRCGRRVIFWRANGGVQGNDIFWAARI